MSEDKSFDFGAEIDTDYVGRKSMIVDDIRDTMNYIEDITRKLGYTLPSKFYYIEDAGCPHKQSSLPKGYAAVYIFAYRLETKYEC